MYLESEKNQRNNNSNKKPKPKTNPQTYKKALKIKTTEDFIKQANFIYIQKDCRGCNQCYIFLVRKYCNLIE